MCRAHGGSSKHSSNVPWWHDCARAEVEGGAVTRSSACLGQKLTTLTTLTTGMGLAQALSLEALSPHLRVARGQTPSARGDPRR